MELTELLSGILGLLIGGLIGHRLALGRDRRREYNHAISPAREKVIFQLHKLSEGEFNVGVTDNDILSLQAAAGECRSKGILKYYMVYSEVRDQAAVADGFGSMKFVDGGCDRMLIAARRLLEELQLK